MGKFMLKLIGMYIPFVLVILGIGACSFIYKDSLLGGFGQSEEVIEDAGELPVDVEPVEESPTFNDIVTEEPTTEEELETVDEGTESSTDGGLPPIGECVCPETDK
jgi:hypothetical protein